MLDVTVGDIRRLEGKLDKLAEGMTRLILIDERQVLQFGRMEKLENRLIVAEKAGRDTETRLTAWVQRGIGVWGAVVMLWSTWQAFQALRPLLALAH